MEFIQTVLDYQFLQFAILAGTLASLACGITGTFVVKKKITFVSGGIAHGVLGGVGLFYFLGLNTSVGALVASLFFSILLTFSKFKFKGNEDTLVGAIWSAGMSLGIIFMFLTPGYNVDIMSFIFGNILMVDSDSLILLATYDIAIVLTVFILYRHLKYISWDEEYLQIRGFNVPLIYFILLVLVSFTVVILLKIVGLILIIALLTIPASAASLFSSRFSRIMIISFILGLFFSLSGIFLSYQYDLPSGATIVLISATVYLILSIISKIVSKT
ncbi:MAG: metal ABC transporter permease [Candidatus Delongbacteria bacterium]|nr:metal ABC transporter permease [Candidatus Delongbacteria bacterium]MBN2836029.1 metal ABC transporter permease [Candidatus Delongbacteria bacterium]